MNQLARLRHHVSHRVFTFHAQVRPVAVSPRVPTSFVTHRGGQLAAPCDVIPPFAGMGGRLRRRGAKRVIGANSTSGYCKTIGKCSYWMVK